MIDIEKFICSLLADHPEGVAVRSDIHKALKEQGLEYKDGKIVPIEDKESEDEKIRKWCISHFRNSFRVPKDIVEYQEYLNNKVIPWLERQGEQKPVVIIPKFRVGDVIRVKGFNAVYRITEISDGYYRGLGWSLDIIEGDKCGDYELVEQTSTWSEEDERMCLCLIEDQEEALDNVNNAHVCHPEIIPDLKEMYNERISWLKSLKYRVQPQNRWKPSGEQMKYLYKYAEQNNYDGAILTGLYDDLLEIYNLKKL